MVHYIHYSLNANKDFIISFTSEFITCFWLHFKIEIPINCLFKKGKWTYIEFWTFKVKCTQYGICEQAVFQNARAICFWKSDGADNSCRSRSKIWKFGKCQIACLNPHTSFHHDGSWLNQLGPCPNGMNSDPGHIYNGGPRTQIVITWRSKWWSLCKKNYVPSDVDAIEVDYNSLNTNLYDLLLSITSPLVYQFDYASPKRTLSQMRFKLTILLHKYRSSLYINLVSHPHLTFMSDPFGSILKKWSEKLSTLPFPFATCYCPSLFEW